MSLTNISFDNTDPDTSVLKYAGDWTTNGSYQASNTGGSGTLSSTTDESANVTFVFPQEALAVYYYGIPRCCGGLYAICLDCDPRSAVTNNSVTGFVTIDAVNRTDNGGNPPIVLWSASFPTPGFHSAILTNQPDPRFGGNSQITLDQFVLEVEDNSTSSSSSSSFSSPTSSTSNTPTPSTSASSTATPLPSRSSSIPIGAILGSVFGAIAVLSLVVFILIRRYQRRRRHLNAYDTQNPVTTPNGLEPFMLDPNDPNRQIQPQIQTYDSRTRSWGRKGRQSRGETTEVSHGIISEKRGYNWSSNPARAAPSTISSTSGSGSGSGAANRTQSSGPAMVERQNESQAHSPGAGAIPTRRSRAGPRRETDAGRVEPVQQSGDDDEDEDDMRTLPPEYEQVFGRGQRSPRNVIPEVPTRSAEQYGSSGRETRILEQVEGSLSRDEVQDTSKPGISLMEGGSGDEGEKRGEYES